MSTLYNINTSFPRFVFEDNLYDFLSSSSDPNDTPVMLTQEWIVKDISHTTATDRAPEITRTAARLNQYFLMIARDNPVLVSPLLAETQRRSGIDLNAYLSAPYQLKKSDMQAIHDALESIADEHNVSSAKLISSSSLPSAMFHMEP